MADIIQWADWAGMQKLIADGNAMVSGMSAAEAAAAMGAKANSGLYVYNGATAAGAGNIINFPNAATAAEAAAEYAAAGGTTSAAGAATAATGAAESTANLTLIQGGAGASSSGVAGLLTMPLPAVAAAIAPVAGVALGVGLYKSNPTLWEKISRTLLPFCYDDSNTLPVAVDANGNTYVSQEAMQALSTLLQQEAGGSEAVIPVDNPYGASPYPYVYQSVINVYYGSRIVKFTDAHVMATPQNGDGRQSWFITSKSASNFPSQHRPHSYTYQGRTVYWNDNGNRTPTPIPSTITVEQYNNINQNITAWVMEYGPYTPQMPEGVNQWQGNQYPSGVTPIQVLTGYDAQGKPIYTPYYPVTIPVGDPGVTTDPSVNPNPTTNPNPAPAVEPYISPVPDPSKYPVNVPVPEPAPLPNPVPSPQPVPGPNRDPSRDPDPDDVPDDPGEPKGGKDKGDSTPPVIPIVPLTPASGASLLHVYNPTQSQIDAFGSWLWTTWSDASIWQTIQKLFNDPMDGIIGLHELYATPALNGSGTIRCGYMDSGVNSALVGTRYTTINCGTIVVEEYYQNYLDYSPYTQVYVYLPFIGIMPLSADDIIGNAVNIKYHVDSYTGCCIAVITVARSGYSSTVYQFEGNCAVEIPITSGYQSALMSGLLAVAGTAVSGNPSVGLTAAHVGRAGLGKNAVQHSGSFGSSYGAMGVKKPYIIVRRPVQKKVTNYSKSYGYPAHKMVYVGNCQGYLRVREVRVMSTTATNIEKEMIVAALKEGVYVK